MNLALAWAASGVPESIQELKNIYVLQNRDFTICEGEIVEKSRDDLSTDVEISTALR
jgi:hypothetical protein